MEERKDKLAKKRAMEGVHKPGKFANSGDEDEEDEPVKGVEDYLIKVKKHNENSDDYTFNMQVNPNDFSEYDLTSIMFHFMRARLDDSNQNGPKDVAIGEVVKKDKQDDKIEMHIEGFQLLRERKDEFCRKITESEN
jgi:hypothetical protein